jgi:AcrR family transcriptional regulator
MNDKHDRRSQRTRRLLGEALVDLIRRKGYSAITVSDLIARANVGRSTFYAHYRDKDDLFAREMERVVEALSHHIPNQKEIPFFPSLGLFRHVREEYELYKALVWSSGIDLLIKQMQDSLSHRIEQGFQESGRAFNVPTPIMANFIAGSFLTLMKWWLENKMVYSPEEIDEIFKKLITSGIEAQRK